MSDSVSVPGAGGTGGKRGQEVTVQPGLAGTALGRQRGGWDGAAGVTSVEVLSNPQNP